MLMSYVADGTYYCRGTFQTLAEALALALERRGGELTLRSSVRRILVEDGRAAGVVLENGQRVRAPLVISNADARQTVEELVGAEHFPLRYRQRLAAASASISAFVVYAATSLDLAQSELAHETFLYEGPDHDAAFASGLRGEPAWLSLTAPSAARPGPRAARGAAAGAHHADRRRSGRALARREAASSGGAAAPRFASAARARARAALRRERDAA